MTINIKQGFVENVLLKYTLEDLCKDLVKLRGEGEKSLSKVWLQKE